MIDLRNYKDLIRELVAKENDKDKNWRWSVKSISKNRVRIRWGYLDYLEEKENCFQIELDSSMESMEWLHARRPDGEMIECYLVVEGKPNPQVGAEQTIQSGLRDAVWDDLRGGQPGYPAAVDRRFCPGGVLLCGADPGPRL